MEAQNIYFHQFLTQIFDCSFSNKLVLIEGIHPVDIKINNDPENVKRF